MSVLRAVALVVLLFASVAHAETYADFAKVKVWTATFTTDVRETRSARVPGISESEVRRDQVSGRVLLRVLDVTEDQILWGGEDGRGTGSGDSRTDSQSIAGSGGESRRYAGSSRCTAQLQIDALDQNTYTFGGSCGEDEVEGSWETWGPDGRKGGARSERLLSTSSETKPLPPRGLALEGTRIVRTVAEPVPGIDGTSERVETHTWRIVPGEIEEVELVFEPVGGFYDRWLPEANLATPAVSGNAIGFKATVQKVGGGVPTRKVAKIEFKLSETSNEKGICLNFPPNTAADSKMDLALILAPGNGPSPDYAQTFPISDKREETITVRSFDYGAWGVLRVTAKMLDGEDLTGRFLPTGGSGATIPRDRDGNHIADWWEEAKEASGGPETDIDDKPAGQAGPGDGIPFYEEYRGFVIRDAAGKRKHQRTEPRLKTLLVIDPEKYLRAEDWRTATGIELFRMEEALAGEGNTGLGGKGNATNPHRGFAKGPEWDYAVRILKEPERVDDVYGRSFPPDDWSAERMIQDQKPKHVRYVGMWPDAFLPSVNRMYEDLQLAISGTALPGSDARARRILAIREFLSTPERQRLAREALRKLADPAARAVIAEALLRRTVVHEVGHACGADHHGVSVVDGAAVVLETESSGPESCPMRYNIHEDVDRAVLPIVEMLLPSEGMAVAGGRFCDDFRGCWPAIDVNDF